MTPEKAIEILRLAAKKLDEMTKPGELRQYKTLTNLDEVCAWIWGNRKKENPLDAWMAEHYLRLATIPDHYPSKNPKPADTAAIRRPGDVTVVGLNGVDYLLILDHSRTLRCFVGDLGRLREVQFPGETPAVLG